MEDTSRPYAAATPITDIDMSPWSVWQRAETSERIWLDSERERIVVDALELVRVVVNTIFTYHTTFISLLPPIIRAQGVERLWIASDPAQSNVLSAVRVNRPVDPCPNALVSVIDWRVLGAERVNGMWIARDPGSVTLTTHDMRRLDVRLPASDLLIAIHAQPYDVIHPEATHWPMMVDDIVAFLPAQEERIRLAHLRAQVRGWTYRAASFARWSDETLLHVQQTLCDEIDRRFA